MCLGTRKLGVDGPVPVNGGFNGVTGGTSGAVGGDVLVASGSGVELSVVNPASVNSVSRVPSGTKGGVRFQVELGGVLFQVECAGWLLRLQV